MGHFSHNCRLSGLPITGGKAVLIVMKHIGKLYGNSEERLIKYGSTYMCSNDGTRLRFNPVWFPIMGEYDTYGGLENIVKNTNTKLLEEYYDLTIEQIVDIVTSGRKDDGYDDSLKCIMDPNVEYEYKKPVYQERYKELLTYSGMWVHGELYERLTNVPRPDDYYSLNIGTPELLEHLGFVKGEVDEERERYNIPFTKDGLTIWSDGKYLDLNEGVYTLKSLKSYCDKNKVNIDIDELVKKDYIEQMVDLVMPNFKLTMSREELHESLEKGDLSKEEVKKFFIANLSMFKDFNYSEIKLHFLSGTVYESLENPFTNIYIKNITVGDLRDSVVRFWRFDQYMYACGKYYEIVGTGPQDGEHKDVLFVLETATEILKDEIKEWYEEEDEEEID
jgi:hypothetical protein